jgi:hypothetical protein
MATETREEDYRPLVAGEWRWDEEIGDSGGWAFTLTHEVLLVGWYDAATAILLPAGHVLMYESEEVASKVMTGAVWLPSPPQHMIDEIAIAGEHLNRLNAEAAELRNRLLLHLPF